MYKLSWKGNYKWELTTCSHTNISEPLSCWFISETMSSISKFNIEWANLQLPQRMLPGIWLWAYSATLPMQIRRKIMFVHCQPVLTPHSRTGNGIKVVLVTCGCKWWNSILEHNIWDCGQHYSKPSKLRIELESWRQLHPRRDFLPHDDDDNENQSYLATTTVPNQSWGEYSKEHRIITMVLVDSVSSASSR